MLNFLTNYIQQQPNGMITYEEYMNLVLYHPELGYYMKEEEKIGRSGDFITTSNVANIFGGIIADWFSRLIEERKMTASFCEIGAGNGRFAHAFLERWSNSNNPEITYYIMEKSPYHQKLLKDKLSSFHGVKFLSSMEELENFDGLLFSNELFDALPVHVVKKQEGKLFEMMVTFQNGELIDIPIPLNNQKIIEFLEEYQLSILDDFKVEIPLQMEDMIAQLGQSLRNGMMVTVDYGYTDREWQHPARKDGSLRGYYKHQLIDNVLLNPGNMDITTHIHWDALMKMGEKYGFRTVKRSSQSEFLLSIGILEDLENHHDPNPFSEVSKRNRAIRSLIIPGGMSDAFQVLIQEKGRIG